MKKNAKKRNNPIKVLAKPKPQRNRRGTFRAVFNSFLRSFAVIVFIIDIFGGYSHETCLNSEESNRFESERGRNGALSKKMYL